MEKHGTKDVVQSADHYGYKQDFKTAFPQILAVSVKNLLLLGYGMTLGFPTILIPAVKTPSDSETLHLENSEISWISSINLIAVPIGCAMSGVLTTPIGRRRAMQAVNFPFFVAWLLFHFSSNTTHLYCALTLTGLAGGVMEAPVLTYVAEITQPYLRGALSATSSMCIIIGVFTQFLFGICLHWRTIALVNITFTILSVVTLFFVPESPHWLVSKKRFVDARKSLQWLRGWTESQAVEKELKDIQDLYKNVREKSHADEYESLQERMMRYLNRSFLIPFFLVCFSFFVGHFSGMTTLQLHPFWSIKSISAPKITVQISTLVLIGQTNLGSAQTYAVPIFQMLDAPLDKYYATLILGLLQIFGSALCVFLVHYTGKRPLTFFSTTGAGICCLFVAGYDAYIRTHNLHQSTPLTNFSSSNITTGDVSITLNPYSWIPTTLLMLLALITHTGIRLLPWILIGEVFSAKTRSSGAGLASAVGYIFGFLTNKMYISMVDTMSIWGTYSLYGIICLTGCAVFYMILPETEGKQLNDIENHFAGRSKLTNNVYRCKNRKVEMSRMHDLKGNVNPSFERDCSNL